MIVVDDSVASWVMEKAGYGAHNCMRGIGWKSGDKLIAGVAYEKQTKNNVWAHIRIDKPPPRHFWWAIFAYPFEQLGCLRISGSIASTNVKAINLNKKMGFEVEASLKDAGQFGDDLIIMVLWKTKCKFLGWNKYGQR